MGTSFGGIKVWRGPQVLRNKRTRPRSEGREVDLQVQKAVLPEVRQWEPVLQGEAAEAGGVQHDTDGEGQPTAAAASGGRS